MSYTLGQMVYPSPILTPVLPSLPSGRDLAIPPVIVSKEEGMIDPGEMIDPGGISMPPDVEDEDLIEGGIPPVILTSGEVSEDTMVHEIDVLPGPTTSEEAYGEQPAPESNSDGLGSEEPIPEGPGWLFRQEDLPEGGEVPVEQEELPVEQESLPEGDEVEREDLQEMLATRTMKVPEEAVVPEKEKSMLVPSLLLVGGGLLLWRFLKK